jgi:hypothetical protein
MPTIYVYVVDRDFGFAPNPFHGLCSLATCKPKIRKKAQLGDWVVGMGGGRLKATGQCLFAMKVTSKVTFDEYWSNDLYKDKKPVRNGSKKTIVGDNIYHQVNQEWVQQDSHHSYPDGSPNPHNVKNDTQSNAVLLSDHFYYFGNTAPQISSEILNNMGYKNGRSYRKFSEDKALPLLSYLQSNFTLNKLQGDPFDFDRASARYSQENNKVTL